MDRPIWYWYLLEWIGTLERQQSSRHRIRWARTASSREWLASVTAAASNLQQSRSNCTNYWYAPSLFHGWWNTASDFSNIPFLHNLPLISFPVNFPAERNFGMLRKACLIDFPLPLFQGVCTKGKTFLRMQRKWGWEHIKTSLRPEKCRGPYTSFLFEKFFLQIGLANASGFWNPFFKGKGHNYGETARGSLLLISSTFNSLSRTSGLDNPRGELARVWKFLIIEFPSEICQKYLSSIKVYILVPLIF